MATVLRMKKEGSCGSAESLLPYPEGEDSGLVEREKDTKEYSGTMETSIPFFITLAIPNLPQIFASLIHIWL